MMKKILMLLLTTISLFVVGSCKIKNKDTDPSNNNPSITSNPSETTNPSEDTLFDEMAEILKHFDLDDEKFIWKGSIEDDFADDMVILVLKRTKTYPKLEIKHFGLKNIESLEYLGGELPPNYYFEPDYEGDGYYHQIVFVYLKEHSKELVVEAIKTLEKLEFVRAAEPNNYIPIPEIELN